MVRLNVLRDFPIETSDRELIDFFNYYKFAESFGWTPKQVDEMDVVVLEGLNCIIDSKNESEKRLIKEQEHKMKSGF